MLYDTRYNARRKYFKYLWDKQNGLCAECQQPMLLRRTENKKLFATLEHIVPQSAGGTHQLSNLELLCYGCNQKRNILYQLTHQKGARKCKWCKSPSGRKKHCRICNIHFSYINFGVGIS